MNTKTVTTIILALFMLLASCHPNKRTNIFDSKIRQHYSEPSNNTVELTKIKAVIFLPREGCQGCISDASAMTIDLLDKRNDVSVIFTVVNDLKLLKRQYGNLLDHPLVSIDVQGLFRDNRVSSIYPQIAYMKNGICYKVEEFGNESEEFLALFNPIN
jgi:hypothetical protein